MLLVGLTGGIGSGKSTVAGLLAARGCIVIDADAFARDLLAPDGAALEDVLDEFGQDLLGPDGALDRRRLAAIVFDDEERRRRLEELMHPRIAEAISAELSRLASASDADRMIVVIDHPLLVETGRAGDHDAVVVVVADEGTRVARVAATRGLAPAEVRARVRAQVDDDARRAVATHVLVNDGTPAELERAVDALHEELQGLLVAGS